MHFCHRRRRRRGRGRCCVRQRMRAQYNPYWGCLNFSSNTILSYFALCNVRVRCNASLLIQLIVSVQQTV